jgi:hypothetical protein
MGLVEFLRTEKEIREAPIHFELYRHLKNNLPSDIFEGIKFVDVIPEIPVDGKAADLVIEAFVGEMRTKFLVLEVKRRTKDGLTIFGSPAEEQAKEYARKLGAIYYAITDGQGLRLFRASDDKSFGDYELTVSENNAKELLKGLAYLHCGDNSRLPFTSLKNPREEIEKESKGVTQVLVELFSELSGKETITIENRGSSKRLNIGSKHVLTLEIHEETNKNCFTIWLKAIKDTLGLDESIEIVRKLCDLPGFQFVCDRKLKFNSFTPVYIKDVATEEPNLHQLKEGLRSWLLKLEQRIK